jgi:uroporphyrinogen decarboxylase
MIEQKGPWFQNTIRSVDQLELLDKTIDVEERLSYVFEALKLTKRELNGRVPLIGFAGAPWTIFCYMVEGKGSKTFSESRKLLYTNPALAHELLSRITDVTIQYLKAQLVAGADALQLFDSWAGILGREQYTEFGLKYISKIVDSLSDVPLTVFSKGAIASLPDLAKLNCTTLGLDWNMNVTETRKLVGETKTLQGNLDPCVLYGSEKVVEKETFKLLKSFESQRHIVNLGHGVYPDIDPEKVKVFIKTVKNHEI